MPRGVFERKLRPLAERFWGKVQKSEGCWTWKNGTADYPVIARGPRNAGSAHAHQVSWELHFGPVPAGRWVLHRCDNPRCVRPDHLFLGDLPANHQDMVSKNRHYRFAPHVGSDNPNAKLTLDQAGQIRERYARGGISQSALAREYGVSQPVVSAVVLGKIWRQRTPS